MYSSEYDASCSEGDDIAQMMTFVAQLNVVSSTFSYAFAIRSYWSKFSES
jgi:hypothetical protein